MKKIRVGVVASGFAGQQHVEAIRRIPGIEVVALADSSAAALKQKAVSLDIEECFTDYEEMIDKVKPDVIHNCTPNALHYRVNQYAITRGIHVYCEKPLGTSIEEAEELAALVDAKKIAAGVNFNYRHNAMVQEMRCRIESGEAGRSFMVYGHYLQDWLMKDTDYNWRLESETGGVSRAVADIGSHWFDTAQCVMNQKIVAVFADLLIIHPFRKKRAVQAETFAAHANCDFKEVPVHSEDAGMILVRFADGMKGMLIISQTSGGHKNDLALSVDCENYSMTWNQESPDKLRIGTRDQGTIEYALEASRLHESIGRYARLPAGHVAAWSDALRNGMDEFYAAIRNERFLAPQQTYATFKDAGYIMKIVDACLKSNAGGTWVDVEK